MPNWNPQKYRRLFALSVLTLAQPKCMHGSPPKTDPQHHLPGKDPQLQFKFRLHKAQADRILEPLFLRQARRSDPRPGTGLWPPRRRLSRPRTRPALLSASLHQMPELRSATGRARGDLGALLVEHPDQGFRVE